MRSLEMVRQIVTFFLRLVGRGVPQSPPKETNGHPAKPSVEPAPEVFRKGCPEAPKPKAFGALASQYEDYEHQDRPEGRPQWGSYCSGRRPKSSPKALRPQRRRN